MYRQTIFPLGIIAFLGCLVVPMAAQTPSIYGSIRVAVRDKTKAVLPGATVRVKSLEQNWIRETCTDPEGRLTLPGIPPGEYEISASAPGLGTQTAKVIVRLGYETSLTFELSPRARRDAVTVTADAAEATATESAAVSVSTHIGRSEVEDLPVNQRNYLDLSLLDSSIQRDTLRVHAAAVTSGFNVMGQRPRNNSIQLDGADLNDESTGGARGSVSMEAVQEFQVLASGYQAEFGRASGGVVNAITKSGGNELHGTLFGFLRHRSLDAANALSPVENPPYTRTQYGASLSGPLRRDKAFYFLSFEQLRRQESGFSRVGLSDAVFSLSPVQQQLRAAEPANPAIIAAERGAAIARTGVDPATGAAPAYAITPLAYLGGVYPVSQRLGTYSVRLDHALHPAHHLAVRFNYAHDRQSALEAQNNDQIAGLLSYGRTAALTTIDPTVVVSLNSAFAPAALNELRASWAARQFEMTPNSLNTSVNIPGTAFLGREPILPHIRTEDHWHFQDTLMVSRGSHLLKFGGDFMHCPADVEYQREVNGMFVFGPAAAPGAAPGAPPLTPVQAYGLGLPSQFVQQFGDARAPSGKNTLGLFAQDSWRARPRLTFDFGLRYDLEYVKQLAPSNQDLAGIFEALRIQRRPPLDGNNLQPRVGFSYQALDDGRLTVRASYGIYYDRLLNLATYLSTVGDGGQMTRAILTGQPAVDVFRLPAQKLAAFPGSKAPTALLAFSKAWDLGNTQQGNFLLGARVWRGMALEAGYVWVRGTHLPRSRDYNPPDPKNSFIRPASGVGEVMAFEDSASSTYHGLRLNLRGQALPGLSVNLSYTWSKALDDAEEIFPHSRNQNMFDFRSDRGPALFDQRHRLVLSSLYQIGDGSARGAVRPLLAGWTIAPIIEVASGRPVNVLLGFDNNRDGYPGSDRPDVVPAGTPGAVRTRYGVFLAPPLGVSGNLGRNASTGPGFVSVSLRLQKTIAVTETLRAEAVAEGFNLLNHTNIRSVNPNYQRAGEPLTAHDPRQIQIGLRLRF